MRKVRAASQRSWKRVGFNEASSGWMRKELEALRADGLVPWGFYEASSGWWRKGGILHEFECPTAAASMRPHPDG